VIAILLTLFLLVAGGLIPPATGMAQTSPDLKSACAELPKNFCANLPSEFEVASIKPAKPGQRGNSYNTGPRGLSATNVPVERLILDAYGIEEQQLEDLPRWADLSRSSRKYTIEAEAPPGTGRAVEVARKLRPDQRMQAFIALRQHYRQMVQSLLAERFNLRVHTSTKRLPVYELVVAKGGPKLNQKSAADYIAAHRKPNSSGSSGAPGDTLYLGVSMAYFAHDLSRFDQGELGRLVIDKTGLTGRYDFELKWSPRLSRMDAMSFGSGTQMPTSTIPSGPSIFTALQEQLGLKLKPAKGPVQVLVVDHIEPPTPN
jgi:uncharacterized protein (TIGR03435 family)